MTKRKRKRKLNSRLLASLSSAYFIRGRIILCLFWLDVINESIISQPLELNLDALENWPSLILVLFGAPITSSSLYDPINELQPSKGLLIKASVHASSIKPSNDDDSGPNRKRELSIPPPHHVWSVLEQSF